MEVEHLNIMQALADSYPIDDLLVQNDVEPIVIIKYLVDEGLLDPEDYMYEDMKNIGEED